MPVVVDGEIEDGDDVGMAQPGGRTALPQEAFAQHARIVAGGAYDLEGYLVAEQQPLRAIDLPHAAGPEAATNGIASVEDGADGNQGSYAFAITSPLTRSWVTSPLCVTSVSRVISSARSNANAFSFVIRCFRNVVMFFAYIWLAWYGGRGEVGRTEDGHAVCDHGFVGPRELAVAAALRRQVHDHRSRLPSP